MDIAVRRANSVDTNYGMTLKYHAYSDTVVTGYSFFSENLQFGYQFGITTTTIIIIISRPIDSIKKNKLTESVVGFRRELLRSLIARALKDVSVGSLLVDLPVVYFTQEAIHRRQRRPRTKQRGCSHTVADNSTTAGERRAEG